MKYHSLSPERLDTLRHTSSGGRYESTKWLGFELPNSVADAMEELADKQDVDINQIVVELLSMGLELNRKNRPHHIRKRKENK